MITMKSMARRSLPIALTLLPGLAVAGTTKTTSLTSVADLLDQAKARTKVEARVPLADPKADGWTQLDATQRLHGPEAPAYLRAFSSLPHAVTPVANWVPTFIYKGRLSPELKAGLGLRVAQINGSPYVAAHMVRLLSATEAGKKQLAALKAGNAGADSTAFEYVEALTRDVQGLAPADFARVRGDYNDAEIVELTMMASFFNHFTRFTEALRLPVETWALDGSAPVPANAATVADGARIALLADGEITAAAASLESAKAPQPANSWRIGMANSQRAMLRVPDLALAWRAVGQSVREKEVVGRDVKLQVSFAVSMANGCRYCVLHQVLGLRRIDVDPVKLVALKKDDSALTPREAVAVTFARKLTAEPGKMTDADYAAIRAEFGEAGALEVLLQTCGFAFMNRFTDGLRLPSEDEAIRVYAEVYGGEWGKETKGTERAGQAPAAKDRATTGGTK